jgi:diguanylate cyclase (GGDEF)-like protein
LRTVGVDHFKQVNDTHGHPCGYAELQEAVRIITATVRAYDTVGRYGGEKFLVVAPDSDASNVLGLAEIIRRAGEAHPIVTDAGEISITVSLGAAISSGSAPVARKPCS